MQTVTSKVETVNSKDGTRIAYEKAGAGPAVVLVDGAFCFRASGVTPKLMPLLSQHFTVYAYDRRGRGDSGNTEPYAVEREIEDLQAIMNVAGESGYVLAFSSGAGLALQAVARGLRPKKLTLYDPPYDIEIMGDYSVPKDVATRVAMPTAVMGGEKSPAKLRGAVEATAGAIRGAKVVWLPKQSHNVKMEVLTPEV